MNVVLNHLALRRAIRGAQLRRDGVLPFAPPDPEREGFEDMMLALVEGQPLETSSAGSGTPDRTAGPTGLSSHPAPVDVPLTGLGQGVPGEAGVDLDAVHPPAPTSSKLSGRQETAPEGSLMDGGQGSVRSPAPAAHGPAAAGVLRANVIGAARVESPAPRDTRSDP
jgi:hypothetical protein